MPLGEIMRISLLGRHERMSAARAREIGLVQEVVPADQLMDSARWAAQVIADMPDQTAVEATVKAIWTAQYMSIHQALQAAPSLIQLAQGEHVMAERADKLRQRKIEPRVR
jgi:enoyl-CoA hydratase/carnithine racemase